MSIGIGFNGLGAILLATKPFWFLQHAMSSFIETPKFQESLLQCVPATPYNISIKVELP